MISLIICAHNEQKYIYNTLLSAIFDQFPLSGYEVIVVDNCSTDATKDIVLQLQKNYPIIKYVYCPTPGLVQAREFGRQKANGDILVYIDADTHIPEGYLACMELQFYMDNSLVAVGTPYKFHDGAILMNLGVNLFFLYWECLEKVLCGIFKQPHFLFGPCFALRASAIESIGGFDTKVSFYGEDATTTKRMGKIGKTCMLDYPAYTSARRYKKEGLFRTLYYYLSNYLMVMLLNKTHKTDAYKEVND